MNVIPEAASEVTDALKAIRGVTEAVAKPGFEDVVIFEATFANEATWKGSTTLSALGADPGTVADDMVKACRSALKAQPA